jgi:hypothetical protein
LDDERQAGHDERSDELDGDAKLLPGRAAGSTLATPIQLPPGTIAIRPPGHTLPVEPTDPA